MDAPGALDFSHSGDGEAPGVFGIAWAVVRSERVRHGIPCDKGR